MISGRSGRRERLPWTREHKAVARRGRARPKARSSVAPARGSACISCTGPVAVEDAEPGDVLEVRILDIRPRPSCHACHAGRCFGSNAAANLGLSLSRPDRGAEAARGHHHLRARHLGRASMRKRSTTTSGRRRPTPMASCIPPSTIPACASTTPPSGSARTSCRASRCRRDCISAPWDSRRRKPISSARSRRATLAATSTTGASARARGCSIRSQSPAPISRSAIPTPRKATASSAAPQSRPR